MLEQKRIGPSPGASRTKKSLLQGGLSGPCQNPSTSTLIITETKLATGGSSTLGPSAPDPLAAPGSATVFPHGNLSSAAPFLGLQTGVPPSAVSCGLERRDHKHSIDSSGLTFSTLGPPSHIPEFSGLKDQE